VVCNVGERPTREIERKEGYRNETQVAFRDPRSAQGNKAKIATTKDKGALIEVTSSKRVPLR